MERMYTQEGRAIPEIPWNVYPRPQMVRKDWLCLNGKWDLEIQKAGTSPGKVCKEQILVPFCPESLLSGIKAPPEPGDLLLYRREFSLPGGWQGKRSLIHVGAVSRDTVVLVNGSEVCRSRNGYLPFSAEITDVLCEGSNILEVRTVNDLSLQFPS